MIRAGSLVVAVFVVLGCRSEPTPVGDDESPTSTNTSGSSDESTAESSSLESESESAESESSNEGSTDEASTDEASTDETTDGPLECGNGQIDGREQCEGDDHDGYVCADLGYFAGILACDPITCVFDVAGCYGADEACGNAVIDAVLDETCDGDELAGQSCVDLGFVGGTLGCTDPCVGDDAFPCSYECQLDVTDCLVADEASPCASEADCPDNVPFCTNDACWDGAEGDPCLIDADCLPDLGCVAGECRDGSEGDPCLIDADCSMPWVQCALGQCQDGMGSPCETSMDCAPMYFCVGDDCTTL
jgi:hypothetical protein